MSTSKNRADRKGKEKEKEEEDAEDVRCEICAERTRDGQGRKWKSEENSKNKKRDEETSCEALKILKGDLMRRWTRMGARRWRRRKKPPREPYCGMPRVGENGAFAYEFL